MRALFASDLHLSAKRPDMVDAFCGFLSGPARTAERLYLLGDIFDEWLGDDDAREPHPRIESALAVLTAAKTDVFVALGNHDFLLADAFFSRTGTQLLAEPTVHEISGTAVLLMHGDELCTDDVDYQAFRAQVRNPLVQRQFLSLPFEHRVAEARRLRSSSAEAVRLKTDDIMDVAQTAVVQTMAIHGVQHLVHGHTHRPQVHEFDLDGRRAKRIVLGDWYEQDSLLVWDEHGHRYAKIKQL